MNSSFLHGRGRGGFQVAVSPDIYAPADNLQATQLLPPVFCISVAVWPSAAAEPLSRAEEAVIEKKQHVASQMAWNLSIVTRWITYLWTLRNEDRFPCQALNLGWAQRLANKAKLWHSHLFTWPVSMCCMISDFCNMLWEESWVGTCVSKDNWIPSLL